MPRHEDGRDNPDFDPARAFWIEPNWELMAHYARRVEQRRAEQGSAAQKGPDEQLERMKARLSGEILDSGTPAKVWRHWDDLRVEAAKPASQGQLSSLSSDLGLLGGDFGDGIDGGGAARIAGFVRALPVPPAAAPSWWHADADLAGPDESVGALAARFGARVQWTVWSRQSDPIHPGTRVERMTLPLQRISLMANQTLREERVQPRYLNDEWDPTVDAMCPNWVGGFAHGDSDAATYRRNEITRQAPAGPQALFQFWSSRPLPAGPSRWTRQAFKLDRDATGFTGGELRTVDLDGDGAPDLAWYQLTGLGPGHIMGRPPQDEAWYRLLLANVAGRWRLLATDQFSYGCGC